MRERFTCLCEESCYSHKEEHIIIIVFILACIECRGNNGPLIPPTTILTTTNCYDTTMWASVDTRLKL